MCPVLPHALITEPWLNCSLWAKRNTASNELLRLLACEAARGIREKRFTMEELVTSVSGRIAEHNLRLNAIFLDLTEQAPADARAADVQLTAGETTRPLLGMLIAVKSKLNA